MITKEGLVYLLKTKTKEKPLPENWLEDIKHYIRLKEKAIRLGLNVEDNKKNLSLARCILRILE